jgi:aminopeptidase YwaD
MIRSVFFLVSVYTFSLHGALAGDLPSIRDEVKQVVTTLSSKVFWGRGYTRDGMGKASRYIEGELGSLGLLPLSGSRYRQEFTLPVNIFPGKLNLSVNGTRLRPGVDFIISPSSAGGQASGDLTERSDGKFVDQSGKTVFTFADKLTWSVAQTQSSDTRITLDRARVKENPTRFRFEIESKFVKNFKAVNLSGVVPGTVDPGKYVVFTAHYDHLGGMGSSTFFPGANDNASGVAFLLSLAKFYAKHPQPFSVAFIFFASEEAGLVGSKYFVEHPLIDLKKIRFLVNFDLVGTGDEGATVVNATEFPSEFTRLLGLNSEGNYLKEIKPRGRAPNSDHYWFSEHGVPAFFLYTMGGTKAYHDIFDRAETLPLTKIDELFELTVKFAEKLGEN